MVTPETKQGFILQRIKGFYDVYSDDEIVPCKMKGSFFEKSKYDNQLAIGDQVEFIQKKSGSGLITAISERTSFLSRTRIDKNVPQILLSNMDNLWITASIKQPEIRLNFIFRTVVAAFAGGLEPSLIFTKSDLATDQEIQELEELFCFMALPCTFISNLKLETEKLNSLKKQMSGQKNAVFGQSGVGKSTLINLLYPSLNLKTGSIGIKSNKGSHTTTSAKIFIPESETFIADTPGLKEFSLNKIPKNNLKAYFPVIQNMGYECRLRDCSHIHEPGCSVREKLTEKPVSRTVFLNYKTIYESLST